MDNPEITDATIGSRLGNVDDLPEELRSQLTGQKSNDDERKILDIVIFLDGVATVNEIMVSLYYNYSEVVNRPVVNNRVSKLMKKGALFRTPGKRGFYQTANPEQE